MGEIYAFLNQGVDFGMVFVLFFLGKILLLTFEISIKPGATSSVPEVFFAVHILVEPRFVE